MSFDVAAAWAASAPRAAMPSADAFGLILSNDATRQLEAVRAQNAAAALALTQTGLQELGATKRQRLALDSERELLEAQIAENARGRRSDRRSSALQFAGTVFANALPALTQAVKPEPGIDALALSRSLEGLAAEEASRRAARTNRSTTFLSGMLKSMLGG